MLTKYAQSLIERNAAINGTVKRQVAIAHAEKQVKHSAYADCLVNRHDDRVSNRKVLVNWESKLGLLLHWREAGDMLRNRDAKRVIKLKVIKITWLARVRNCFTGNVRTLRIRSVSNESAKRKAMQSIRRCETLLDVTEKRFAVQ